MSFPVYPFDIETGPQAQDKVLHVAGEFNPADVKLGNLTDPKKIEEKIEKARATYIPDCMSDAALNPYAGMIKAIGYYDERNKFTYNMGTEQDIITDFFDRYLTVTANGADIAGWNSHKFDNNFIRVRALLLNIPVPHSFFYFTKTGFISYERSVDLMHFFSGGPNEGVKLDIAARGMGHAGKNGDGAQFWQLLATGVQSDRTKAIEYLANDLEMTTLAARTAKFKIYDPLAKCDID